MTCGFAAPLDLTGWNLLLPAVALVTAVAFAERQRLLGSVQPGRHRLVAVWVSTCRVTATAGTLICLGIVWQASR